MGNSPGRFFEGKNCERLNSFANIKMGKVATSENDKRLQDWGP